MAAKILTLFYIFLLPTLMARLLLRFFWRRIHSTAKVGFSLIYVDKLYMAKNTRIGHFNLINCRRIVMRESSYFGRANIVKVPVSILFLEKSAIDNGNEVVRAEKSTSYSSSILKLGIFLKITVSHKIDCMRSILIGDYTAFAGVCSQVWTHGYYHEATGPGRFRVDGKAVIGNNVYTGLFGVVSMGVTIADAVTVGSHSSVSKNLLKPGIYVSQPLRYIESSTEEARQKLIPVTGHILAKPTSRKPSANA